jgi:hypothetical protein
MDRATGAVIRRYEHDKPGELVHVDIKKLGNIPRAAGKRPSAAPPAARPGPALDTATSTPPSMTTPAWPQRNPHRREETDRHGVLDPGPGVLRLLRITIQRVLTDNGSA